MTKTEESTEVEALRKEVARLKLQQDNSREDSKTHRGKEPLIEKWCYICEESTHTTKECECNIRNQKQKAWGTSATKEHATHGLLL